MFKTILVPTDGSALADNAINLAVEFGKLHADCKIIGLAVAEPYPFSPLSESALSDSGEYERKMRESAHQSANKIETAASAESVACEIIIEQSFDPADEITKVANRHHCDVIIMTSHMPGGIKKFFMGSQTEKVLAQTSIPVLVLR
jgi:nucleotide-binding universal stress UspA family protein